jgi:hypothetical protein
MQSDLPMSVGYLDKLNADQRKPPTRISLTLNPGYFSPSRGDECQREPA